MSTIQTTTNNHKYWQKQKLKSKTHYTNLLYTRLYLRQKSHRKWCSDVDINSLQGYWMKLLNTTPGNGFLYPLFLPMLIKPTYDKFYRIVYTRGRDKQTTEVVDATSRQITDLIKKVAKGRLTHPEARTGRIPSTNVKVYVVNGNTNLAWLCNEFAHVYNLSPREVRLRIEEAIDNE